MSSIIDVLADRDSYIAINLFTAEIGLGVFVVDGEVVTARLTDDDYEGLYLAGKERGSPFLALLDDAASWAYSDAAEADALRKWEERYFPADASAAADEGLCFPDTVDDPCLEQYQPDRDIGFDDDFTFGPARTEEEIAMLKHEIRSRIYEMGHTGSGFVDWEHTIAAFHGFRGFHDHDWGYSLTDETAERRRYLWAVCNYGYGSPETSKHYPRERAYSFL